MQFPMCRRPYPGELFYGYMRSLCDMNGIDRMEGLEHYFLSQGADNVSVNVVISAGVRLITHSVAHVVFNREENTNKYLCRYGKIEIENNISEFSKIVGNVVLSAGKYVMKSLNLDNNNKIYVQELVDELRRKDFKQVVKTALNASINDGIEVSKIGKEKLVDINTLKNVSLKGGLNVLLSAGVDIVMNKFLKNNLLGNTMKKFVVDLKNFIMNKGFDNKIENFVDKLKTKVTKFNELCTQWYKSYENLDISKINEVEEKIKNYSSKVSDNANCVNEANIISNMTKLVNTTQKKLTDFQMQLCQTI